MLELKPQKWDEWAIKAELRRRGLSFRRMATRDVTSSMISAAFKKPNTHVNQFISGIMGIPVQELWPDWFDFDGDLIPLPYRKKLTRLRRESASPESRVA